MQGTRQVLLASRVAPIVEMFDIAADGEGAFSRRPFVKVRVSPVIPPKRHGEDAVDVVLECIRHTIPISCITAAQAGAAAPATPWCFPTGRWWSTCASELSPGWR